MLSFECIKNGKSVYFLLTSAPSAPKALAPTVRRILGCVEPFCGYLPNSRKIDRGNAGKQTKTLLRASFSN